MKYLEITNDNNIINIDDNKKHYELYCILKPKGIRYVDNGRMQLVRDTDGYVEVFNRGLTVSLGFRVPNELFKYNFMIFVECDGIRYTGGYSSPTIVKPNGTSSYVLFCSFSLPGISDINNMHNRFKVYVFSDMSKSTDSKVGMQVFKDNDEIIFDTNKKYPRIIDFLQKYYTQGSGYYESPITYNNTTHIAISPISLANTTGGQYRVQSIETSGHTINFYDYNRGSSNGSANGPEYQNNTRVLVADVSHLQNERVYNEFPILN